jgi:hypothetical protein
MKCVAIPYSRLPRQIVGNDWNTVPAEAGPGVGGGDANEKSVGLREQAEVRGRLQPPGGRQFRNLLVGNMLDVARAAGNGFGLPGIDVEAENARPRLGER